MPGSIRKPASTLPTSPAGEMKYLSEHSLLPLGGRMKRLVLVLHIFLLLTLTLHAETTFTEYVMSDNTAGPSGLYCCDLDNDGDQDILAAVNEGNYLAWFRNNGEAAWQWERITIWSGMTACHSVHANDLDGDGDLDVLATTYGNSVYWFRNEGGNPPTFQRFAITSTFTQAHEVYSADIDDDGDIDVMAASSALNRISLWYNNGGNPISWEVQVVDNACGMAKSVTAGDLDGDGAVDLVAAALIDNDILWYRNGGGTPIEWEKRTIDGVYTGAHRVQAIDVDQDGNMDVVGAAYLMDRISWWRNSGGEIPSWTRQTLAMGLTDACVAKAADLDNDGDLDIAGTAQGINTVVWFENQGTTPISWIRHDLTTDFERPWPLDTADLDGDGDEDIVSASSYNGSNEVRVWINDLINLGVKDDIEQPTEFVVQASPNPFNASVSIHYSLPVSEQVSARIVNLLGIEVAHLVEGRVTAGMHTLSWDGTGKGGQAVSSGVYLLTIKAGKWTANQRLVLVK